MLYGLKLSFFGVDNNINKKNLYLSIASTKYDNGTSPDGGMTTGIEIYDLKKKKLETNPDSNVEYTSQSPLAVMDKTDNTLYYSAETPDKRGDQLFSYNFDTKEEKQLTNEFFAVNKIIPQKDRVVLVACAKFEDEDTVFIFDKKTQKVKRIKPNNSNIKRYESWLANYNPITGKIVFMGWDYDEWDKFAIGDEGYFAHPEMPLDEYKKHYKLPTCYYYELVGDKLELVYKDNNFSQDTKIATDLDGNLIIGEIEDNLFTKKEYDTLTWSKYNIKTKKVENIDFLGEGVSYDYDYDSDKLTWISEEFYFIDKDTIVFKGTKKDSNIRGIYEMDLKTKKVKTIKEEDSKVESINYLSFLSY
jgi:hypothetical protein